MTSTNVAANGIISLLLFVLRIVSALKKQGIKLSDEMDRLTGYENSGEINYKVEDKKGMALSAKQLLIAVGSPPFSPRTKPA